MRTIRRHSNNRGGPGNKVSLHLHMKKKKWKNLPGAWSFPIPNPFILSLVNGRYAPKVDGKGEGWGEKGLLLTQQDPLPSPEAPLAPQVSGPSFHLTPSFCCLWWLETQVRTLDGATGLRWSSPTLRLRTSLCLRSILPLVCMSE